MIRIGTRDSKLAVWQAELVRQQLAVYGIEAELVYIKSEGDIDLHTPLYAMGVQGVFTRSLDIALLTKQIDIAVHSMKDVPTQLPEGIVQAAVLTRGPVNDLLVAPQSPTGGMQGRSLLSILSGEGGAASPQEEAHSWQIATSSIRRKAQWLHRYPNSTMHNIRGNVITRLGKLQKEPWDAVIFAQAGLERINVRPAESLVLDWMLPAPAQGAIMVVCRGEDAGSREACALLNDTHTALCTQIERDFLKTLMGGCSTPISALARVSQGVVHFKGNIYSLDGREKAKVEKEVALDEATGLGVLAAKELLANGGQAIVDGMNK